MRRTGSGNGSSRPGRWELLQSELLRCRRYRRPFALLRIPSPSSSQPGLMLTLGALLRRSDRVWAVDDAVYLLLPESDRPMAEGLLARFRQDAPGVLDEDGVRLAVFPVDGATSGALLAALEGHHVDGHAIPASWLSAASRD